MSRPRITTTIIGFTASEWQQITLAANTLTRQGAPSGGLVILPGRPEFYVLRYARPGGLSLELATDEEAAALLAGGGARQSGRAACCKTPPVTGVLQRKRENAPGGAAGAPGAI